MITKPCMAIKPKLFTECSHFFLQTSRRQLETVIIPRLNKIAELQEELRECVSPADIRAASQRLWILRQRQADLEHRLEARYVGSI